MINPIIFKEKEEIIIYNDNKLYAIPDYIGYYADESGEIYSTLGKGCRDKFDLSKRVNPYKLNPRLTNKGYCRVYLRKTSSNKRKDVYVHRIIASLFVENPDPDNYNQVNHKDTITTHNHKDNLEWCNSDYNIGYALKYGNMDRDKLGKFCHK